MGVMMTSPPCNANGPTNREYLDKHELYFVPVK